MKATAKKASAVALPDRLEFGFLTIDEVRALKGNVSKSKFYQDARAGLVSIEKHGAKSLVRGPIAKRYIAGEVGAA